MEKTIVCLTGGGGKIYPKMHDEVYVSYYFHFRCECICLSKSATNHKSSSAGKPAVDFPSDSNGTDWGYSCYFQFTVSDVKGDWIQFPKRPFSSPVWVNLRKDWAKNYKDGQNVLLSPLEEEVVYLVKNHKKIVITKFKGTKFNYRSENANDMNCDGEPKEVPSEELKESIKPISDLFDEDGHLVAWPAYCRGC
ncbi:hypothetical protein ACLVWU_08765 [Bdellovibrio sp. HCB290]|uniref:hypothetical protein n=1 Tax=Bdellovibrio sp. HCB290 TaxID=3394356 RepID=UPI0039B6BB34